MVNDIIDGIVKTLKTEFDCDVYTDSVEQDLEKPCFFVFDLNPNQERKLRHRHKQTHPIAIQYLPEDEREPNVECNKIIPTLFEILELIEIKEGLIQTFNINAEIVNGVLNCFATYTFYTKKVFEEVKMEEKELKAKVKND